MHLIFFTNTILIMRFEFINFILLTIIICSLSFTNEKTIEIKGWDEILATQVRLLENVENIKKAAVAFEEELTGKSIQLKGYFKQIQPHFSDERDYYFTPQVEPNCLPLFDTEEYCGLDNPNYIRVLFNGSGKEEKDMDILFKPHRNKYSKEKGKLKETILDDGNYKVYTYDKSFELAAKIKLATINCKSIDCSERYITIHIDDWSIN